MADATKKLTTVHFLVIYLLLPLINSSKIRTKPISATENPVDFGFECNARVTCDPEKNLACSDGICKCSEAKLFYELDTSKCVVKMNKSCLVGHTDNSINSFPTTDKPAQTFYACEKHARCDFQTGICVPKGRLHDHCSKSLDCRHDLSLLCRNGGCVCDPNKFVTAPTGCVAKVDTVCGSSSECVPKAECVGKPESKADSDKDGLTPSPNPVQQPEPTPTSTVSPPKSVCKCVKDHLPTQSGGCAKNYGIDCRNHPCPAWLKCGDTSKSCECPDPTTQIFDGVRGYCVVKVNGECNKNVTSANDYDPEPNLICVRGGECVKNSYFVGGKKADVSAFHCRCKPGFAVENKEGTCDLVYGSECEEEGAVKLRCDVRKKLACVKGRCDCEQVRHIWDEREQECVGLSGALCSWKNVANLSGSHVAVDAVLNETYLGRGGCARGGMCELMDVSIQKGICKCAKDTQEDGSCGGWKPVNIEWIIGISGTVAAFGLMFLLCYMHVEKQGDLVDDAMY